MTRQLQLATLFIALLVSACAVFAQTPFSREAVSYTHLTLRSLLTPLPATKP